MSVKIIVDSLGDIPAQVAKDLGMGVIPINVIFGTQVYRDGVDITPAQFYDRLEKEKISPTTSVPPLDSFIQVFKQAAEETDEIVVITISKKLSGTNQAAQEAARMMDKKCKVEVIDSKWLLMGEGLLALKAAKMSKAGASFDDIVKSTHNDIPRISGLMVFDTLEYLRRGGRIGKAKAFLGSLLKLHPVLSIKDGEIHPFAREGSRAKGIDCLYKMVMGHSKIDELAVEDATTPGEADTLADRLAEKFPREDIYRSKVSPVLGAHTGPHVIGAFLIGEK
ncbi:MAG: DegV family protein [Candidatus Margulisiibacteriota bacterium]|nr:DegV family protein [Candidatus Margulisiibacteriota bacterium]